MFQNSGCPEWRDQWRNADRCWAKAGGGKLIIPMHTPVSDAFFPSEMERRSLTSGLPVALKKHLHHLKSTPGLGCAPAAQPTFSASQLKAKRLARARSDQSTLKQLSANG
ncbi:hypothetical protein GGD67_002779 [Bradyrhizobium sp. IAR9]|uniref:hypothetical protein n=1 Tax=Bradyrhizobium sp. IAR9 TaxID=2663841 RepID=UPI0015CCFE80|nr:hypothetical protein [Bradyrhizobium sp. IAR9]NYG45321.1 hypothetical protein [Bradyrhizobium sp. IAR9]